MISAIDRDRPGERVEEIAAARTAVPAVPITPDAYATPTGTPCAAPSSSKTNEPTYPTPTTTSQTEWSWDARHDHVAATSTTIAAPSRTLFRTRPTYPPPDARATIAVNTS